MKRLQTLTLRSAREISRDPLTLFFGVGFPLIVLLLLSLIQRNLPPQAQMPLFELASLTPGVTVFGLSFFTLFSASLLAKDRESALLQRLYTTPATGTDFMLSYALPILPMVALQGVVCYAVALLLGLSWTATLLPTVGLLLLVSLLFIALGLLFGSLLSVKQVGGVCGALLTNLTAWLSGVWFDLTLLGGAFRRVAEALPFFHAVELERAALRGDWPGLFPHLWWVLGYTALFSLLAVWAFSRQARRQ